MWLAHVAQTGGCGTTSLAKAKGKRFPAKTWATLITYRFWSFILGTSLQTDQNFVRSLPCLEMAAPGAKWRKLAGNGLNWRATNK